MMTEKHEQIESQNKKLADDMWVAIVDMCPLNEWIPLRRDVELATDILKMFIDLDCYGENFSLVLKPDFSSFMKRPRDFNGYKTKNTAKPLTIHIIKIE